MSDEMREKVRDIIANSVIGIPFDDLMEHKLEWLRLRGTKNGQWRDVNDPHQCDVTEATDAILSLFTAELERVERERDEARAGLAYVLDHAEYGDSYGVHGSDFTACHFCRGGGAPGVEMTHDPTCPVAKYPNAVEEWFGEMADAEARATAAEARLADLERERDEALALTECCTSLKDMAACVIQGAHAEARLSVLD